MIDSKICQKMMGRYLEASDTQEEYLWHCVKSMRFRKNRRIMR